MTGLNVTINEVYEAYLDCRKRKRSKDSTTLFEMNLSCNLTKITRELNNHSWQPGSSMCFVVRQPKPREVWAATFNDRVVHHVVYNRLRPRIEPKFINTSFACIKKRGTLAAADWAHNSARKVTNGWSQPAWALQLDIANFFPTIDREFLWSLIEPYCYEPWLKIAMERIIVQDVTKNAYFPGNPDSIKMLPPHKSLWNAPIGKGLPIGNLTSQFAANIYLNEIDQFIIKELHPNYYGRYVDDLLLMNKNKKELIKIRDEITNFLFERLQLKLHYGKTRLQPVSYGIDFVGWKLLPYRKYVRKTTVSRASQRFYLHRFDKDALFSSGNSYLGLASHGNTWNLRNKWQKEISQYCEYDLSPNRTKLLRRQNAILCTR